MIRIDLNCDLGEGFNNEAELMPLISSCNIACGGHAGTLQTIDNCVQLAKLHRVRIGAHPSFEDPTNFGRQVMEVSPDLLLTQLISQVKRVQVACARYKVHMHHIKAHGALYNLAAEDEHYAQVLIDLVKAIDATLFLVVPFGSKLQKIAVKQGIAIKKEAFVDRNYQSNYQLVPRNASNALIGTAEAMATHLVAMVINQKVMSVAGVALKMEADTYCIHGDQVDAAKKIKELQMNLKLNGINSV